jgi:hypothetical protein
VALEQLPEPAENLGRQVYAPEVPSESMQSHRDKQNLTYEVLSAVNGPALKAGSFAVSLFTAGTPSTTAAKRSLSKSRFGNAGAGDEDERVVTNSSSQVDEEDNNVTSSEQIQLKPSATWTDEQVTFCTQHASLMLMCLMCTGCGNY